MFGNLLKHPVDVAAVFLRVGVAAVFLFHGYLKVVVGNDATSELVSGMSTSAMLAVGWAELICATLVGIGLFTRPAALALALLQVAAITVVSGSLIPQVVRTENGARYISIGLEFNVAMIAMCLALIALGAGLFSVDHVIANRIQARRVGSMPRAAAAAS
jgi:uncharacterized membrane protein YphA (DoxX/SURF4 family)